MPFSAAKSYVQEFKRITRGLIYASFFGHNYSTDSDEFLVSTKHEEGTIQSVYDEEKICNLFGVEVNDFKYFIKITEVDTKSKLISSSRFHCVISGPWD